MVPSRQGRQPRAGPRDVRGEPLTHLFAVRRFRPIEVNFGTGFYDLEPKAFVHQIHRWGNDNTALHLASFLGETTIVEQLLHQRANPNIKNGLGLTARDVSLDDETRKAFDYDASRPPSAADKVSSMIDDSMHSELLQSTTTPKPSTSISLSPKKQRKTSLESLEYPGEAKDISAIVRVDTTSSTTHAQSHSTPMPIPVPQPKGADGKPKEAIVTLRQNSLVSNCVFLSSNSNVSTSNLTGSPSNPSKRPNYSSANRFKELKQLAESTTVAPGPTSPTPSSKLTLQVSTSAPTANGCKSETAALTQRSPVRKREDAPLLVRTSSGGKIRDPRKIVTWNEMAKVREELDVECYSDDGFDSYGSSDVEDYMNDEDMDAPPTMSLSTPSRSILRSKCEDLCAPAPAAVTWNEMAKVRGILECFDSQGEEGDDNEEEKAEEDKEEEDEETEAEERMLRRLSRSQTTMWGEEMVRESVTTEDEQPHIMAEEPLEVRTKEVKKVDDKEEVAVQEVEVIKVKVDASQVVGLDIVPLALDDEPVQMIATTIEFIQDIVAEAIVDVVEEKPTTQQSDAALENSEPIPIPAPMTLGKLPDFSPAFITYDHHSLLAEGITPTSLCREISEFSFGSDDGETATTSGSESRQNKRTPHIQYGDFLGRLAECRRSKTDELPYPQNLEAEAQGTPRIQHGDILGRLAEWRRSKTDELPYPQNLEAEAQGTPRIQHGDVPGRLAEWRRSKTDELPYPQNLEVEAQGTPRIQHGDFLSRLAEWRHSKTDELPYPQNLEVEAQGTPRIQHGDFLGRLAEWRRSKTDELPYPQNPEAEAQGTPISGTATSWVAWSNGAVPRPPTPRSTHARRCSTSPTRPDPCP
ncbi:hypothetical protein BC938DRAFT_473530 [Jimgerdemannia flammicorona]|uniref:Uncharacterized protein n=1 Tax=Jimgerdemannia flammicorona TaxID=994334 RepID=A0A433Q3S7_9FUNG|nr:hypothetical protein BC938DRAFT_473530 [Jimgerdemannia flammicorona]